MSIIESSSRRNAGYTIDQTILIVAVIAILITLIIASVGWDLLKRTGGTKLAAQLRQLEDANGGFYARIGMWPDAAVDASGGAVGTSVNHDYVGVLYAHSAGALLPAALVPKHKNLIAGLSYAGGDVSHGMGTGGNILQGREDLSVVPLSTTVVDGSYLIIEFEGLALDEAQEADEAVDGVRAFDGGRVVYSDSNAGVYDCGVAPVAPATQVVDVCYIANLVD